MKNLFVLGLILTTPLLAETIKERVHAIEDNLVKFENGRVAFMDSKKFDLNVGELVEANINDNSSLLNVKTLAQAPELLISNKSMSFENNPPAYDPTIIPNMKEARAIYERSNPYYKRVSECSDRAHVWAHDEFRLNGTKSMKAFVFFTASYINSVRFKWWFHVAPMYKVNDGGTIKDIVMDYRYTDGPKTVKEWTDHFVYTKRPCKVTTKFSEYDVNPQTENCYLMFESMHYRLPGDLSDQETQGTYQTETTEFEYNFSKKAAFQSEPGLTL